MIELADEDLHSDRHGRHFDAGLPMTLMLELLAVAFILALAAMPALAKDAGVPSRVMVPTLSTMPSSHVASAKRHAGSPIYLVGRWGTAARADQSDRMPFPGSGKAQDG
jgi:hypothetical protein